MFGHDGGLFVGSASPFPAHFAVAVVAVEPDGSVGEFTIVPPDGSFVGIAEIAEQLQVSRQRASQLAKSPNFPSPLGRTKAGSFWFKEQVEMYSRERQPRVERYLGLPKHLKAQS